jgi:CBS domain-containing protein
MKTTAREIMTTTFHTLTPQTPVSEAVRLFKQASVAEGRKVFGMMVVDESQNLVGMISMHDILIFMRPKHVHVWGAMEDIDVAGIVGRACDRTRSVLVGDNMTPDVVTIVPDTHIMVIMDIIIKKHIRRLPVVEDGKILGIVYISNLFYDLLDRLTGDGVVP